MGFDKLENRVVVLERGRRRMILGVSGALAAWVLLAGGLALTGAGPPRKPAPEHRSLADSVLRVRGLVVVDGAGVERVIIGAPVPDPISYGRRGTRLGGGSGILLLDADGNERSGYLTSDELGEVFLTLDAAARQQALFLANATGGANLTMRDHEGNGAQLAAVRRPIFTLRRAGEVVTSLPDTTAGAR